MRSSHKNRIKRCKHLLAAGSLFLLLANVPVTVSAQISSSHHDDHWIEQFYPPGGMDGTVRVATIYQGDLIVGGDFAAAGNTPMKHIGRWDGQEWHSIGSGFDFSVVALLVHDGKLFAGGNFTLAGGDSVNHVAFWDGTRWNPMGKGFLAPVTQLTVYDGQVIAGGGFSKSRYRPPPENPDFHFAALWNGGTWEAMGTYEDGTALNGIVRDLIVYKNDLIAAGPFWSWDPVTREKRRFGAATWDGTRWNVFGPELSGGGSRMSFESLISYGGNLIAGGVFQYADGIEANRILAWDGQNWFPIGEGFDGSVRDLVEHNGSLVATGYFTASGANPVNSIVSWDGNTWTSFGDLLTEPPATLASFAGSLFAGGSGEMGGETLSYLASWNGSSWQPVGDQAGLGRVLPHPVTMITHFNNQLLVNTYIYYPRGPSPSTLAWDGTDWCLLVNQPCLTQSSTILVHAHHGSNSTWSTWNLGPKAITFQGDLVMGNHIWNGSNWEYLSGGSLWDLRATGTFQGKLVHAGRSGSIYNIIEVWDGQGWTGFGFGLGPVEVERVEYGYIATYMEPGRIQTLTEYGNDLIAGGFFGVEPGKEPAGIARWDGSTWHRLGSGIDGLVIAMKPYGGDLVAAGNFNTAGGEEVANIARWDGSTWHPMGKGIDGPVYALQLYNGRLIAAGLFQNAGNYQTNNVAAWDGIGWSPLGTGTDGEVLSMTVLDGDLYLGGDFGGAGGKTAYHIARWNEDPAGVTFSNLSAGRNEANEVHVRWLTDNVPFDHKGFHVYRQEFGTDRHRLNETLFAALQIGIFVDTSPPVGPADYWIAGESYSGKISWYGSTSIAAVPGLSLTLTKASPNPFAAESRISFTTGTSGPISLIVYDVAGRRIRSLVDETRPAGQYEVEWNGLNDSGQRVSSGIYFYRLDASEGTLVRKMVKT